MRWLFLARAMPKSITLMLPSGSTMMFCGLMSRWMISCLWATEAPGADLRVDLRATFLGSRAPWLLMPLLKVGAAQVLHDDVIGVAVLAPIVDAHDIGGGDRLLPGPPA